MILLVGSIVLLNLFSFFDSPLSLSLSVCVCFYSASRRFSARVKSSALVLLGFVLRGSAPSTSSGFCVLLLQRKILYFLFILVQNTEYSLQFSFFFNFLNNINMSSSFLIFLIYVVANFVIVSIVELLIYFVIFTVVGLLIYFVGLLLSFSALRSSSFFFLKNIYMSSSFLIFLIYVVANFVIVAVVVAGLLIYFAIAVAGLLIYFVVMG
ncbi:uncharacterized protein DS421_18g617470 [Arachis hypogaea]|nr:uncharacterized protein DS421_18g617470 [Arachis hypogaea]